MHLISGNDLINDLLGDVAFVLFKFDGFHDRFNSFNAVHLKPADQPVQQLHISHAQLHILLAEVAA